VDPQSFSRERSERLAGVLGAGVYLPVFFMVKDPSGLATLVYPPKVVPAF
jgi:hypothetical protein